MEPSIYNLSIGGTHRGRVYLSALIGSKLRIDIVYPDDAHMPIEASNTRDLVAQFKAVMKEKYGDEKPALMPAKEADIEEYQRIFREKRDAFLKEFITRA